MVRKIRKSTLRPSMLSLKIVYDLFVNKKGITIKDLAKNLKTDYKNIYDTVDLLFNKGVIKKEKIGNYNICRLNYFNEDLVEYLKEYNFYIKIKKFKKKHPDEYRIIIETIKQIISGEFIDQLFVCLVFGSYAESEEKKDSDLDILFITTHPDIGYKKELNKTNLPYQKKFHISEQTLKNFINDLNNKTKLSIATELYKQPPIVFYGEDIFFRIILKANYGDNQ